MRMIKKEMPSKRFKLKVNKVVQAKLEKKDEDDFGDKCFVFLSLGGYLRDKILRNLALIGILMVITNKW